VVDISSRLKRFFLARLTPTVIAALVVTGTVVAMGVMMSNVLTYPIVVNNAVAISSPALGPNGTAATWFVGVAKNVSVVVKPQAFVGTAHVVYELDAPNITCNNVSLIPITVNSSVGGCQGTNQVTISTNSQVFPDRGGNKYWFFDMVITAPYPSLTLEIYVVRG
jgi:hypothetical protein